MSSTERAICPITEFPKTGSAKPAVWGTSPALGFMPTTPTCAAGRRVEPPPSVQSAIGPRPAATALAAPPDDPPGVRARSHGLRVGPKRRFVVLPLHANSEQFVVPRNTAPAARRRATATASSGATKSAKSVEPWDAGRPFTQRLSLTVNGTPASASVSPRAIRRSTASASPRPARGSKRTIALRRGFNASIRATNASSTSTADARRPLTSCASSAAVAEVTGSTVVARVSPG